MSFLKESVFASTLRSFCNALGIILGIFIGGFIVLFMLSLLSSPILLPEKSTVSIAPDAEGRQELLSHSASVILRIDIRGVIGLEDLTTEAIRNILIDSRQDFLEGNRVKAIFLYVNTPGGAADDSAGIHQALLDYKARYKVPIYAFVDGLCASGGMYICSAADKIYATAPSVIGSVGVLLGPSFNVTGLMDKIGVYSKTITQGKDKDMLSPFRPWKEGEDQSLINITKSMYDQFVDAVTTGRKNLDKQQLITNYGAQVFDAETSKTLGYIDVPGAKYDQCMKELALAAEISEKKPYQVVLLKKPKNLFSELAQSKFDLLRGRIHHTFQIAPFMSSELSGKILYLYQPTP